MMEDKEKILTVREFAKFVYYSERRIRQMIADGKIAADRIPDGRKLLIPINELDRIKKEAEETYRSELVSTKTTQGEDTERTRSYDMERFVQSDGIMNEMDLAHLLDTLHGEHSYTLSDFQKVLRWVSFFNLKSNDYYNQDIRQHCSQLLHDLTELNNLHEIGVRQIASRTNISTHLR
ncbi:hypothetical protein ACFLYF_06030 [Chloroflexota bacterium]